MVYRATEAQMLTMIRLYGNGPYTEEQKASVMSTNKDWSRNTYLYGKVTLPDSYTSNTGADFKKAQDAISIYDIDRTKRIAVAASRIGDTGIEVGKNIGRTAVGVTNTAANIAENPFALTSTALLFVAVVVGVGVVALVGTTKVVNKLP